MVEVKERPKAPQMRGEQAARMAPTIRKIGVVGAGQIGEGIATINGNLARQVSRQRISDEQRQAAIKRIAPANTLEDLGDCDLVIEAATESEAVKRTILAALCPLLKP